MRFNKVLGIGGIGAGLLFLTDNNATLGRSESRLMELSEAKDYCKQHIVFHYIAELLCPTAKVYPIGYVGNDAHGASLLEEIDAVGMDTTYICTDSSLPTMLGVVIQYTDKETCNFTASNSACNKVTPEYVEKCMDQIGIDSSTIVAAIPEVRVESRLHMLRCGKEKGAFTCLSVPESEADAFKDAKIFKCCDLLAVNYNEALALSPGAEDEKATVKRLYTCLKEYNAEIMLMVTCGKSGAFSAYKDRIEFVPSLPAKALVTTGAGDACLGGAIAGLAMGLPFQKGHDDKSFGETPLLSALELGTLCAGMAVEVADSIAKHVTAENILKRVNKHGWKKEDKFL